MKKNEQGNRKISWGLVLETVNLHLYPYDKKWFLSDIKSLTQSKQTEQKFLLKYIEHSICGSWELAIDVIFHLRKDHIRVFFLETEKYPFS